MPFFGGGLLSSTGTDPDDIPELARREQVVNTALELFKKRAHYLYGALESQQNVHLEATNCFAEEPKSNCHVLAKYLFNGDGTIRLYCAGVPGKLQKPHGT